MFEQCCKKRSKVGAILYLLDEFMLNWDIVILSLIKERKEYCRKVLAIFDITYRYGGFY